MLWRLAKARQIRYHHDRCIRLSPVPPLLTKEMTKTRCRGRRESCIFGGGLGGSLAWSQHTLFSWILIPWVSHRSREGEVIGPGDDLVCVAGWAQLLSSSCKGG